MLRGGWGGYNGFNSALKQAAFEEDMALTFQALNTNVSTKPDYLPLVAAAGVLLLQVNHIAKLYI